MTHTGKTSYTCKTCNAAFIGVDYLRRHMQTHLEKPHMLTHIGEKPYTCKICGIAFRNLGELKVHMLTLIIIPTEEKP